MKKLLSAMLALVLLFSFAACGGDDGETSEPETTESGEPSDDVSGGEAVAIEHETIVSVGKSYTTSIAADSKYEDTFGTELCDGVYTDVGSSYADAKFSGFAVSNSNVDVTFDMGEDYRQLYKFGVSFLNTTEAGIGGLGLSRVYFTDDLEGKWTRGPLFRIEPDQQSEVQMAWATLDEPIDARYVRFSLKGTAAWLFLDELVIISNTEGSSLTANYLTQLNAAYSENRLSADDLLAGSVDVSRDDTLVSATKEKSYTVSRTAGTLFPDESGNLLTDGAEAGATYESGAFVGYDGGEELTVDIPLGDAVEGLSDFSLSMFQQANLRYMLPYYVDFYISADGDSYDRIGRVYAPNDLEVTNFTFSLHFRKGFTAKAVRFVLAETDTACFLIEEADASYHGEDKTQYLYPPLELPEVTEPTYWPNPSSAVTNLALGLPYQIVSGTQLSYAEEIDHNTLADAGVLTDGQYSPDLTFNNGCWNRTRNGGSRSIYFDLGANSSITGFKINYLQYRPYAIVAPSTTNLYLSEDGLSWYSVGIAVCSPQSDTESISTELTLETPFEARFACVSFSNNPHSYADEIEIYGSQAITGETKKLSDSGLMPSESNRYMAPSDDILGGVTDMALIYYGTEDLNEDFFLPYVAYLDADGNIKDTLFDGFLFLPSPSGKLPSGGLAHEGEQALKSPTKLVDWQYQLDENFKEGQHFDALNKAAAKVKEALSLPSDYKFKVYPTIMYPHVTATDFGDIDGDGVSEDFSKLEDRVKAISVYMQMYIDRFAEAGFENLSLNGFYWFAEAVAYEANDTQTLPAVAKAAKEKGTQIFWIPYYVAKGYSTWSSYGFAAAYMQPNYVFNLSRPTSQLYTAAALIRNLGMGIELEVNDQAVSQLPYYRRYMRYLGYGAEAGYMTESIHAFYQSVTVIYDACYSGTEMGRSLYDATYGFIKGTLAPPEKLPDVSETCKAGETLHGELLADVEGINMAELTLSAENGSVTLDPDGGYWYVPNEGFTGTDSFTFRYSDYLLWSEETTVTVTVE